MKHALPIFLFSAFIASGAAGVCGPRPQPDRPPAPGREIDHTRAVRCGTFPLCCRSAPGSALTGTSGALKEIVNDGPMGTDSRDSAIRNPAATPRDSGRSEARVPATANPAHPRPPAATFMANCTGYDNDFACTGKRPGDPDYGITASGTTARMGTVAAPKQFRFGTRLLIQGLGLFVVEDRGHDITGVKLDLWFPSHAEALRFGRKNLKVTVNP